MMVLPKSALLCTILAASGLTSCRLFRKAAPTPPPAVSTPRSGPIQLPETPKPKPPEIPPPDVPATQGPDLTGTNPAEPPATVPAPPKPPRRASGRKPVAGPPAPESQSSPEAEATVPQLRPILTPEQQQQLNDSVNRRLERAQQSLRLIEKRRLNRQQAAAAQQIRTFIHQAQEARSNDLLRANNLAERADVLAEDLLRTMF